jgi:hypothetical protein
MRRQTKSKLIDGVREITTTKQDNDRTSKFQERRIRQDKANKTTKFKRTHLVASGSSKRASFMAYRVINKIQSGDRAV